MYQKIYGGDAEVFQKYRTISCGKWASDSEGIDGGEVGFFGGMPDCIFPWDDTGETDDSFIVYNTAIAAKITAKNVRTKINLYLCSFFL